MHNLSVAYRGFSLLPFAAFDAGRYASILVIEDSERRRRSTGVLGNFDDADTACKYALEFGMSEIDGRLQAN